MAYGTPHPMVARLPDRDVIIPSRIFKSLANQLADVPESAARITPSGSFGDNSQKTRSGLRGLAETIAWPSTSFHHRRTPLSTCSRQLRSSLRLSSGMSARSDSFESPDSGTSTG